MTATPLFNVLNGKPRETPRILWCPLTINTHSHNIPDFLQRSQEGHLGIIHYYAVPKAKLKSCLSKPTILRTQPTNLRRPLKRTSRPRRVLVKTMSRIVHSPAEVPARGVAHHSLLAIRAHWRLLSAHAVGQFVCVCVCLSYIYITTFRLVVFGKSNA